VKNIRNALGTIVILVLSIIQVAEAKPKEKFALVIHGGAGTILKKNMTPEKEAAYRAKLEESLKAGYKILSSGGSALDAVEATIHIMEDSPLFNAGKGAVFTNAGTADLKAGAVAGVKTVKNPITAARKVMEETWHVLLAGEGADKFAAEEGLEIVDPKYFYTERRWKAIQKMKKNEQKKYGTVGCVALDKDGNLAAGTSTGGMTNKRWGRVGDVPIIGAGTYANNETCAVSATGTGEYFIRAAVAHDISALMEYKRYSLIKASKKVIQKVGKLGGSGGVICIDAKGNIAMPFNTKGMYRGYIKSDGKAVTLIYKND